MSSLTISLKESEETSWWLQVLHSSDMINLVDFSRLMKESSEITKILITIIKNTKYNCSL
jgi:four helix bundle protein